MILQERKQKNKDKKRKVVYFLSLKTKNIFLQALTKNLDICKEHLHIQPFCYTYELCVFKSKFGGNTHNGSYVFDSTITKMDCFDTFI